MTITLFSFCYRRKLVWKQCPDAVSDLEDPHYKTGMAALVEYAQYSFNLQHNIAMTVLQQSLCMATYEERHISTSRELTQLKCENDLLCGGTVPPFEQDQELKVTYHRLSEGENTWHCIHQQLDASREMVDERTHTIIHLEHANK
jgi:hypothetical protein